MKETKEHTGP